MSNKDIVKSMKGFVVYEVKGEANLADLIKADNFEYRKYKIAQQDELSTIGFLPTVELEVDEESGEVTREEEFVSEFGGLQVISIGSSKRKIPGNEVKKLVAAKSKAYIKEMQEKGEDVKVDKELKEIFKEDAIKELMPKCFVDEYQAYAFHDTTTGQFFVFAGSYKKAEQVNSLIRAALGSFPVVPVSTGEIDVGKKLGEFITIPLNDKLVLTDVADIETDEGVVLFKKESLYDSEVAVQILKDSENATVTKLGMDYDGIMQFVVSNELVFSGVKFESYMTANGHDFKSTFLLAANEVKGAVKELLAELSK